MVNQNPAPPTMSSVRIAEELEAWPERFALRLASVVGTRTSVNGDSVLRGPRPTISSSRQLYLGGR